MQFLRDYYPVLDFEKEHLIESKFTPYTGSTDIVSVMQPAKCMETAKISCRGWCMLHIIM